MASTTALHLGPFQYAETTYKHAEAADLRADVNAFVAAGGVIEKLAHGAGRKLQVGKTRQSMTRAERTRASSKRQEQRGALPGDNDLLVFRANSANDSIIADCSLDEIEGDDLETEDS